MSISVLIVDDHPVVAEGLRHLVETQEDMRALGCVTHSREALRRIAELEPDVVVMDVSMPELNGIEAANLIHDRTPNTQVVMLSMHSNQEYVLRALQAGARGYLLKQSASQDVLAAIRAVHQGRRFLSPQIVESVIDDYLRSGAGADRLGELSSRERQVLQLVVEGNPSAVIAKRLSLSPKTIETYRVRIMHKLGVKNVPGLVKFAIRHGLTTLE